MFTYPSRSDLRDVIREKLGPARTRAFYRQRGILLLSHLKEDLAGSGSGFFLGYSDVFELRQLINEESNYRKSARLYVTGAGNVGDVVTILAQRSHDVAKGANVIVIRPQSAEEKTLVQVEYTRRNAGMNDLLVEEQRHVTFTLEQGGKGLTINVSHQDRGEFKVIEEIIQNAVQAATPPSIKDQTPPLQIKRISLKNLTPAERLELFDRFFMYAYSNWRLSSVRKVSLKREGADDENEKVMLVDDEEGDESAAKEGAQIAAPLQGLTTAVLEGSGLRQNSFVQQCLHNGFYFSGCRIRLKHRLDAKVIELDLSFRSGFGEFSMHRTGLLENDQPDWNPYLYEEQDEILSYFQDVLCTVYDGIVAKHFTAAD